MNSIRSFEKEDIPAVVEMFQRLLLKDNPSQRNLPIGKLTDHFENIFFNNPWYDHEITSLVSKEKNGKINGFLGVVPRPMRLCGQPIRVAVTSYHMASPESRPPVVGIQLLKTFFSGPQDLSLTDGAGELGRRIWVGVGGMQSPLYSLQWERLLRPARFAVETLSRRRILASFEGVLSPAANLADSITTRLFSGYFPSAGDSYIEEDLDLKIMIELLPLFTRDQALQPVYQEHTLQWIFDQADQMRSQSALKKVMIRNTKQEVVGWYLYYVKTGRRCRVLHIAAKNGAMGVILNHLFNHARRQGATALYGGVNPKYIQEIANQHCFFRLGASTLIHSRNEELIRLFQSGDAAVSGLDGEWCLKF
jgi:hypothetical protein